MKKIFAIFVCTMILLSFAACTVGNSTSGGRDNLPSSAEQHDSGVENVTNTSPLPTGQNKNEDAPTEVDGFTAFSGLVDFELIESGEYYKVYRQTDGFGMYYEIWNEEGDLMDFEFHKNGSGIRQNGNLLEFSIPGGTYSWWIKYFDVHNSRVSRFYNAPLATKDELVVYTDFIDHVRCVVVHNIFDPSVFYKAIVMDPVPDSVIIMETSFIDSQHIQMTYSTKDGIVTQVYSIE